MKREKIIKVKPYKSPYGTLILGALDDKLCLCDWQEDDRKSPRTTIRRLERHLRATSSDKLGSSEIIERTERQLDEYFAGERREFDIPLLLVGTEFQKMVWEELRHIPFGETISYGEQARRLGSPKAVRAVAGANGANAISILLPCHRVIGRDRSLTGYGGGMDIKRKLLEHEGIACHDTKVLP